MSAKIQLLDDRGKKGAVIEKEKCCGRNLNLVLGSGFAYDHFYCHKCRGVIELTSTSYDYEPIYT